MFSGIKDATPMKRIFLIDNYDSFTFNLRDYLWWCGWEPLKDEYSRGNFT